MAFPDDALTNSYRLNNVSRIDWTVYANKDFTNSNISEDLLPDDEGASNPESQTHGFLELAIALRKMGVHAIFDPIDIVIWTFQIHSAEVPGSDETARYADVLDLLALYGLTATLAGNISPTGVSKTSALNIRPVSVSGSTQRYSNHAQDHNVQAYESNSKVKIEPDIPIDVPLLQYEDAVIISRLTASISMSIIFSICVDTRWLSLGMYSCIGPFQSRDHGDEVSNTDYPNTELSVLSIEVQWVSSGCLLIRKLASSVEGQRRLSEDMTIHGSVEAHTGSRVCLVPSGMKAIIIASAVEQYEDIKRLITARLKRQNINLAPDTGWVRLRHLSDKNRDDTSIFIWPASLCLLITGICEHGDQEGDPEGSVNVSRWVDPLEAAERWFLDAPARDHALEAKRKAHAITVEVAPDIHGSSDDEGYLYEEGISNGRLILQDMSAVYPTPPDGAPLSLQSVALHEQIKQKETGGARSTTAEVHLDSASMAASPTFQQTPRYNDDDEPGDLFGDIDSEMFAANGLTEDDFNFFDDQNGDQIDLQTAETGVPSQILPNEDHDISPTVQNAVLYQDGLVACTTEPSASVADEALWIDHMVEAQDHDDHDSHAFNRDGSEVDNSAFNSDMVEAHIPKNVHVLDFGITVEKAAHLPSEAIGALDSIDINSLRASEVDKFDQKYYESGPFGYDNVKTPEGDEPGKVSGPKNTALLRVDNIHDSVSTSEESDDPSTDQDSACASEQSPVDHVTSPTETHEQEIPPNIAHKRKRERSFTSDIPLTPSNSQPEILFSAEDGQDTVQMPNHGQLIPSLPMPCPSLFHVSDDEDIQWHNSYVPKDPKTYLHVAQLLADHSSLQNVDSLSRPSTALSALLKRTSQVTKSQSDTFESALYRNFPSITQCDLKHFASIGKGNLDQIPTSSSQTVGKQLSAHLQMSSLQEEPDQLFMINTPLLRVQRMETQMDISTSALPFWEELGLAPASSEKDVIAFCICPESAFVEEQVIFFLESVRSTYQSHKLGTHRLGLGTAGYEDAFVPVTARTDGTESSLDDLFDACGNLGRKLATLKAERTNFVIYMVNTSTDATRLPHLCEAFLRLSESYASVHREQKVEATNDMSLHILPLASIASNKHLVIPEPAAYRRVAFEVYNRCAPLKNSDEVSPFFGAPAVLLARTIPRTINLQFTTTPVAGLPLSDRCIHVGYCWNPRTQWLSASWTDTQGSLQWSACYCVATTQNSRWPTLHEVAREVWDTTMDMINSNGVPWKVYIAKMSRMSKQELDVWLALAMETVHGAFVTIITVDEVATLQFMPHPESDLNPAVATFATPVSTPAANTVSPEQSGYASTPGAAPVVANLQTPSAPSFDPDNDARLVDITEEIWGVVTGIPSCNTSTFISGLTTTFCAALVGGYLVKRAGSRDQDGLLSLAVDIVHAQKANHGLMKDVLIMYRNLGTLARSRENVESVGGLLPCHLAIAKRGFAAVQALMPWTEE